MTILTAKITIPEETPGVCKSSWLKSQTEPDYIQIVSGKKYETVNTQVECEENLNPDAHMFPFQELIEEVPDVSSVIMT